MEFTMKACLDECLTTMIMAREEAVRKGDAELIANIAINMFEFASKWKEMLDEDSSISEPSVKIGFIGEVLDEE